MSLPPPPAGMDIEESAVPSIVAGITITWVLSYSAIALRFVARRKGGTKYWWDDWLILGAGLALIACIVEETLEFGTGTGRHIWWVAENHPDWLAKQPIYIYADQKNYPVIISLIKLSILCLYIRLFGINKWISIICYVQMTMVIIWAVVTEFVFIFQCTPLSAALTETRAGGKCFEFATLFLGTNVVNVILDFGVLLTPIYPIWSLQLPLRRKLVVTGILLIGGGESIFSILRVVKLSALSFIDATWDNGAAVIWSDVEANIGVFCACIPVLGPLLPRSWLGGTTIAQNYALSSNSKTQSGRYFRHTTKATGGGFNSTHMEEDNHELVSHSAAEQIRRTTEVTVERGTPEKISDDSWSSRYGIAK